MNNKNLTCFRFAFMGLLCLLTSQAFAQKKELAKLLKQPLSLKPPKGVFDVYIPRPPYSVTPKFTNATGVPLNPHADKHSIYPSKSTVLGSPKVPTTGIVVPHVHFTRAYINATERAKWREVRERLLSLTYYKPVAPDALGYYLRHSVPAETFKYIQTQYTTLVAKIEVAKEKVMPTIVYASLPGEGILPTPEEVGKVSEIVYPIILQIRDLRTALPDDPFLERQQLAWEEVFAVYNPLLASMIVTPSKELTRLDKRVLVTKEFNLYNPDGTDYLLPRSETLLVDPDELEEMDSYFAVREKMRNPPIKPEDAEAERAILLDQLPTGLRIAFINDDTLPRVNFENWGKNGYLGHNATIETFADGNGFMEKVRNGAKYDLVITDLLVPYGGISMMPQLRQLDQKVAVIASSKFDRGEEDEEKLFNLGIDGYFWYNSNVNEGAYGYIEYLRAMKNYYFYKAKYNWQR